MGSWRVIWLLRPERIQLKTDLQKYFRRSWLVEVLFLSVSVTLIICYESVAYCEDLKVGILLFMSGITELVFDCVLQMLEQEKCCPTSSWLFEFRKQWHKGKWKKLFWIFSKKVHLSKKVQRDLDTVCFLIWPILGFFACTN